MLRQLELDLMLELIVPDLCVLPLEKEVVEVSDMVVGCQLARLPEEAGDILQFFPDDLVTNFVIDAEEQVDCLVVDDEGLHAISLDGFDHQLVFSVLE